MKNIYDDNFLLFNSYGKRLFHEVAKDLPIIDWHNHVDPSLLATDKSFDNIYQLWVQNDPYKHRAMRIFGIAENLITGSEPTDYDKFLAWAKCLPHTVGNPLFHWSCMELKQVFGIDKVLTTENAAEIWATANALLKQDNYRARAIVKGFGLEMLCTSDDLLDSLEHHISYSKFQNSEVQRSESGTSEIRNQKSEIQCLPSLRSDSIINFNQPAFFSWLEKLENLTEISVKNLENYKKAVVQRLDFFDTNGCLLSDHSFDGGFQFIKTPPSVAARLFDKFLEKKTLTDTECIRLQSHVLHFLGIEYAKRNWKMQLHIGAHRFTSSTLRQKVGAAGGFAGIGKAADISSLCYLLDELDLENSLPKTILYTLNPADNAAFATLTGSFSTDNVQGKIQFGPAWWYNDHYEGITQQLLDLSSYGLLSTTIGFTTDSRSILSFTRHDYYRRILCNLIGSWVETGKLPDDWAFLSDLVRRIAYENIKNWIKK
jgi:glucuronate isomerase